MPNGVLGHGGVRHHFQLDPDLLAEFRLACRIRIRLDDDEADLEQTFSTVQSMLVSRGRRLQNAALYKGKQQLEFFLHIPAELDMRKLELDLRAVLPNANSAKIAMDIV